MLSRREAFRTFGRGAALGALAAGGMLATGNATPAAESTIEAMFAQWRALHDRDWSAETEQETDRIHAIYLDLQERIIRAEPKTPRDVALQFWCDTHCATSDWSDLFWDQMNALVERRAA